MFLGIKDIVINKKPCLLFELINVRVSINADQNDVQFASSLRWRKKITENCGIDNEDIDFIIKRLERTGFISKITRTYFDYAGGEIKITKSFLRFMEYIKTDSLVSELQRMVIINNYRSILLRVLFICRNLSPFCRNKYNREMML